MRVGSLVGLLLELGLAVGESNIEFFGSLDDGLPARVNTGATYLVLADRVVAISAQYVLLFIRSSSRSFSLRTSSFLNPFYSTWRVFLAEPLPMVGMAWLPLNLRRILLSIPWGVLHDFYTHSSRNKGTYADSVVFVGSEAVGVILLLLDDLGLVQGLDCHLFIFNKESRSNAAYIFTRII